MKTALTYTSIQSASVPVLEAIKEAFDEVEKRGLNVGQVANIKIAREGCAFLDENSAPGSLIEENSAPVSLIEKNLYAIILTISNQSKVLYRGQ